MSKWNRTTRKLPLEKIQPEITAAIQEHIETYNLGPILDDYLMCTETVSTKKKKGLFGGGGEKETIQVAILTPVWLVIGVLGDQLDSSAALTVKLKEAEAVDFKDTPMYKKMPDNGVSISGVFTGRVGMHGSQRISYFMFLGEDPAADELKEELFKSVRRGKI